MKRLIYLLILILLVVIAYFEWVAYKHANIPGTFTYQSVDNLDLGYHDAELVADYYQEVADVERYGRYCWKEYQLDVRADRPIESPEKELVAAYQQKLAWIKQMEAKLQHSFSLKQQGLSKEMVEMMLNEGLSQTEAQVKLFLGEHKVLQQEEQGEGIYRVQ